MTLPQFRSLLHSSSFQFSVTVMALIWSAVAAVLLLLYFTIRSDLWADIDQSLQKQLELGQAKIQQHPSDQLNLQEILDSLNKNNTRNNSSLHLVRPGGATMIQGMGEGKVKLSDVQWQRNGNNVGFTVRGQVQVYEYNKSADNLDGSMVGTKEMTLPGGYVIQASQNVDYIRGVDKALRFALFTGLTVSFFLAVIGSAFITRKTLVRLSEVNKTCNNIRSGDLNQRVPVRSKDDDFDKLGININSMLDQIQGLMSGIQNVSDNIAHDLKTPLSRLRSRLEMMRIEPPKNVDDALDEVIRDTDRILAMFHGLLRIAKLESGSVQPVRDELNMSMLLADVTEMYEPVAEEKNIELLFLNSNSDAIVCGDADLWFQVFINVIDNAIKYTPEQGKVWVSLNKTDTHVEAQVTDSGVGIPEEEYDNIFERFYRMEKHRGSPGHGLGLSLVKVVAAHYDSSVELKNADPGLIVSINIPIKEPVT
jgi:signal transduction histidine kinase